MARLHVPQATSPPVHEWKQFDLDKHNIQWNGEDHLVLELRHNTTANGHVAAGAVEMLEMPEVGGGGSGRGVLLVPNFRP